MAAASNPHFLHGDAFASQQTLEDNLEADYFFVFNSQRPAFADGQDAAFAEFKSVHLPADSLCKLVRLHETFDGHQSAS